jgi:hypothetical protein
MRPGQEAPLKGRYTTKRDGGLTYEYDGLWFADNDRIVWAARVRRDGQVKAVLDGNIGEVGRLQQLFAARDAITTMIADRIEKLAEK